MTDDLLQLREKQVGQLAFYVAHPKCLDLSDPGTGKTPPCCVYSFMEWHKKQKKTLWSMPKSLLKKNKMELHRFTPFEDKDVAILTTDRANLTKKWTGATIESTRRVATWRLKDGSLTHEQDYGGKKLMYVHPSNAFYSLRTGKPVGLDEPKDAWHPVDPLFGPDGKTPVKEWVDVPETFKDLIVETAKTAKVFICTFAFMSAHWERLLKAAPDIDLLLVDELHMGYGGLESKQTESFYWVNKHVSRFVGMTGTLINGRLDSAFPAIHVIEPRYYGGRSGFIYEHCAWMDDYGRVTMWKNEEKLAAIINKHSIRRTFEEVYGREDVVFFTETLEMEEKVQEAYDEFEQTALLELDDGRVLDGSMAGVNQIRARQIMGHPETMLTGLEPWTPKDERIEVHLSGGKKALIFAALQPEQERIKRLCESLGLRTALINANVSGPQRAKIDEAAQRGELDVIVASGPTVAVGFNWEMFDLVIFASIDFMDVNILQAYRRASRGTRTSTLHVIFLRYVSKVEDRIFDIVTAKSQLANRVDPTRPVLTFTS